MEDQLVVCCEYLKTVEQKLREIHSSMKEPKEVVRLSEALSFIQQAKNAISPRSNTMQTAD